MKVIGSPEFALSFVIRRGSFMRPYFAIIKDSFREAIVSRVLWVVLGLIVIFLLLIARRWDTDQTDRRILLGRHPRGAGAGDEAAPHGATRGEPSPGRRVWELLDEDARDAADSDLGKPRRARTATISRAGNPPRGLNKLITSRDLYTEADWRGVSLRTEAKDCSPSRRRS